AHQALAARRADRVLGRGAAGRAALSARRGGRARAADGPAVGEPERARRARERVRAPVRQAPAGVRADRGTARRAPAVPGVPALQVGDGERAAAVALVPAGPGGGAGGPVAAAAAAGLAPGAAAAARAGGTRGAAPPGARRVRPRAAADRVRPARRDRPGLH